MISNLTPGVKVVELNIIRPRVLWKFSEKCVRKNMGPTGVTGKPHDKKNVRVEYLKAWQASMSLVSVGNKVQRSLLLYLSKSNSKTNTVTVTENLTVSFDAGKVKVFLLFVNHRKI